MSNNIDFKRMCIDLRGQLDRVTAERDALQALLTAADERADVLEGLLRDCKTIFKRGVSEIGVISHASLHNRMECTLEEIIYALKPADGDETGPVSLSEKALGLIDEEIRKNGMPS